MKRMKHRGFKSLVRRIVSLALMLATVLCLVSVMAGAEEGEEAAEIEMVDAVFATTTITFGTRYTANNIEVRQVPAYNAPNNIISTVDELLGKFAAGTVYEGDYIYAEKVANKKPSASDSVAKIEMSREKYIDISEYITKNTKKDVSDIIQGVINANPQRTIYFPDGTYYVSKPIYTSARPTESVSLLLSDGAVIKAMDSWKPITLNSGYGNTLVPIEVEVDAVVALGAGKYYNDNRSVGSYYGIQGGTIDGNGLAKGVSVDSGRESLVKNITMRNCTVGVHVKRGGNGNSSDIDVDDITIIGGKNAQTGIIVWGFDNTVTNVKVYDYPIGMEVIGGGNLVRNFQAYYSFNSVTEGNVYNDTRGIIETDNTGNWYYDCYIENYATAYTVHGVTIVIDRCTARWTTNQCNIQTMFRFTNDVNCIIENCRADFYDKSSYNKVAEKRNVGRGGFSGLMVNESKLDEALFGMINPAIPIQ